MYELHNRNASTGRSYEHTSTHNHPLYFPGFVQGQLPKTNNKELCRPGFITILSINYDQAKLGYGGIRECLTEKYAWTASAATLLSHLSRSIRLISIANKLGFTLIKQ